MVSVRTIERRTPWRWETLLVVNGVVGRAEEMLCLEERPPHPFLTPVQLQSMFLAWLANLPGPHTRTDFVKLEYWGRQERVPPPLPKETLRFIDAIHRTAESVSFSGSSKEKSE